MAPVDPLTMPENGANSEDETLFESLSAYVDGGLTEPDRAVLERRLSGDPALRAVLAEIQRTTALLRVTPQLAPPRNFTLDPARYGRRPGRTVPVIVRWGAALAAVLIVAVVAVGLLTLSGVSPGVHQVAQSGAVALVPTSTSSPLAVTDTPTHVNGAALASPTTVSGRATSFQKLVTVPPATVVAQLNAAIPAATHTASPAPSPTAPPTAKPPQSAAQLAPIFATPALSAVPFAPQPATMAATMAANASSAADAASGANGGASNAAAPAVDAAPLTALVQFFRLLLKLSGIAR